MHVAQDSVFQRKGAARVLNRRAHHTVRCWYTWEMGDTDLEYVSYHLYGYDDSREVPVVRCFVFLALCLILSTVLSYRGGNI